MKKFTAILAALLVLTLSAAVAETQIIAIPDDSTNLCRGIKLLEAAGLIEVDPAVGNTPELKDITKYVYDIEIVPARADMLTATLKDYAGATINSTNSVPYGLIPSRDGLIIEDQSSLGDGVINIIAARTADADNETYKTIVAAYQTPFVASFMIARYKEARLPAFPYDKSVTMTEEEAAAVAAYETTREGKTVVKVGVCGAQNDEWIATQKVLDDQGANIYIELVEFDAYNLPNEALNAGDIDLNSFQHNNYFRKDTSTNGYDLTPIGDTLVAPLTLFSEKYDSLDALKDAAGLLE